MAVIDEDRGVLVIRIVYDGPALSGKTTSLKALARGVSSQVDTPAEASGRTLFFDWVEYVGGLFDGRQIRCQIVSVPGQRELSHRRKLLLETADTIVLVLDTREEEWDFGLTWVGETAPYCRSQDPPIGLVVQANKRDAPDAISQAQLRAELNAIAPAAVVPSTATTGDGIREAFVLAVRLALDRVRALDNAGHLAVGKPNEDSPRDLLERLQLAEPAKGVAGPLTEAAPVNVELAQSAVKSLEAELEPSPHEHYEDEEEPTDNLTEKVFVPDPMMPGGMIWPPVDGRALLHEVASLQIRPTRTGRTDWCGSGSGFRFHSLADAIFPDLSRARSELLEWARLHSANTAYLSLGRAVILADAGAGRLRLWQIVRAEATLRERLALAQWLTDPSELAKELVSVAERLTLARDFFGSTTVTLPCTLWTVGSSDSHRPPFVGLMPSRDRRLPSEPIGRDLLLRELSPQLRELRRARVDYSDVVSRVSALATSAGRESPAHWLADVVHAT